MQSKFFPQTSNLLKKVPIFYNLLIFWFMVWITAIQPGKLTIQIDFCIYFSDSLELFYLKHHYVNTEQAVPCMFPPSPFLYWANVEATPEFSEILWSVFWLAHSPVLG